MWPAAGHETIDNYDVKCNEVQPCDGYDVIKLEVASLIRVRFSCGYTMKIISNVYNTIILAFTLVCVMKI